MASQTQKQNSMMSVIHSGEDNKKPRAAQIVEETADHKITDNNRRPQVELLQINTNKNVIT